MFENSENIWIPVLIILACTLMVIIFGGEGGKSQKKKNKKSLGQTIAAAGYAYDPRQDIFYSRMDAWQKNYGYCQLYDEATAPLSMIIDCEPIRFEYAGKRWMIELWKGQYGMTTGCEVGVYNTDGPDLDIPGYFNGTFYNAADKDDHLYISCALRKNRRILFTREGRHWWLTGFILGMFSEPFELTLEVAITMKDSIMLNSFVNALLDLGYREHEFRVVQHTVWILFDKPHSPQPLTRIEATDRLTQRKNELLCEAYQELTKGARNSLEKISLLRQKSPELFDLIINMGKPLQLFKNYEIIKNHIMR